MLLSPPQGVDICPSYRYVGQIHESESVSAEPNLINKDYAPDWDLLTNIVRILHGRGETISTAESCTGGLLATWLTDQPGSSSIYLGGAATYSNEAKTVLVGVDSGLIRSFGAVSAEVAEAMAEGIRNRLGSSWALSLTGVAGPGGGSVEKPVGTVWCGLSGPSGTKTALFKLHGDRREIRVASAEGALRLLLKEIRS
jgi:nicotinamide-nucleotide amidase